MLQRKLFILILLCLSISMNAQISKKGYQDILEPKSKLLSAGGNYTVEEVSSNKFIFKRFYPENNQIIYFATYTTKQLNFLEGAYYDKYDDGTIIYKGTFLNNLKTGEWIENEHEKGNYIEGKRVGDWVRHDSKNRILVKSIYVNGELDGTQLRFDTLGNIKYEEAYKLGELISTTQDTTNKGLDVMPRFDGCEEMEGTDKEKKDCADKKMLEYVYSRIKYPHKAIKDEVEGKAIVQFIIDKEGAVTEIKVLRGITKEIKAECLKIVENMPKWQPGMVDGKPVKVQFKLPITFRLQ